MGEPLKAVISRNCSHVLSVQRGTSIGEQRSEGKRIGSCPQKEIMRNRALLPCSDPCILLIAIGKFFLSQG